MIAKSWDELRRDPLVSEYMHVFERDPPSIETAAEILGEKRVYAFLASRQILYSLPGGKFELIPAQRKIIAPMIMGAPVYFLSQEMFPILIELQEKCRKASEDNPHFVPRKMPSPFFWFSCSRGWQSGIEGVPSIDVRLEVDVSLIEGEMIRMFGIDRTKIPNSYGFYVDDKKGLITLPFHALDFSREAILMLIEEKICQVDYEKPNRGLLRACKKIGIPPENRVGIIRLRTYQSNSGPSEGGPKNSFEYAHQWLVRGHVRNQFYPSAKEHRLIWIDPYRKGPEDAPFKESVRVLVR